MPSIKQPSQWTTIEHSVTLNPMPGGPDWSYTCRHGYRREMLEPRSCDLVVTSLGEVGWVMHTVPGRPPLPAGGRHRYVLTTSNELDASLPVLAWHVSHLTPFEADQTVS